LRPLQERRLKCGKHPNLGIIHLQKEKGKREKGERRKDQANIGTISSANRKGFAKFGSNSNNRN
jgi:hypothetical protein